MNGGNQAPRLSTTPVGGPALHSPTAGRTKNGGASTAYFLAGAALPTRSSRALFSTKLRALWTARLSATHGAPGQIQVVVQGAAGQTAVLETTTNLQHWTAAATNTVPFTNTLSIGSGRQGYFRAELR